ncbi:MAG TPA: porin [Longimicrobiaceae bacterium]|nr:porin [Longimicrobiaceae bacterium]
MLEQALQTQSAALARMPRLDVGPEGVRFRTPDEAFQLRLRGYVQEDGRFVGGSPAPGVSTFVLRRVRPIVEGTLYGHYDFRLMTDFGEGKVSVQDAYADVHFIPQLRVRAGKFKPPVGLERLQSATNLLFVERALPTSLVPSRDVGLQPWGEAAGGALGYAVGVFDGVADGGTSDGDADNGKEVAGRVFLEPFRNAGLPALHGLGVGVAGTRGTQRSSPSAAALPSYRTVAQLPLFAYRSDGKRSGTALADGRRTRFVPQGYYYAGPFGALAEYVSSAQQVRLDTAAATLHHRAWQLSAGYVLTGERASFSGVKPRSGLDPSAHTYGALEVVGRAQGLRLDGAAFPVFADPARSPAAARGLGTGVNWYLAPNLRLSADYDRTTFEGGATTGDRRAESAFLTRLQLSF